MKGMNGQYLAYDLTKETHKTNPIPDKILLEYLGGRGLAVKLFVDDVKANLDPLSKHNELVFATGPLTGTIVPTSGRLALVTKSPLTKTIFFSNTGGHIAPNLKKCGFDALVIKGKAKNPKYLVIYSNNAIELKDATDLWGLDTRKTFEELMKLEGDKIHILVVGPAGENLVSFASIMNDGDHRAFGRGGVGAVMGSKNLKAIVIKNQTAQIPVDNADLLKNLVKPAADKIKLVPITRAALPMFGTASLVNLINEIGMFPINNFQKGYDERAEQISGEEIRKSIFQEQEGCFNCPIRCGRMTKVGDAQGKGPEYESLLLGSNTGIFDLETVTKANYECNLLGLDTISTAGTIACVMELVEKGIINEPNIKFGNKDILVSLIRKIAMKEGIGEELAEGSRKLALRYNHPEISMEVKGLELPAYDPRGAYGHALGYATSNRGGCHLTGYLAAMEIFAAPKKIARHSTAGKSDLLVLKQHQSAIEDSLVVCAFAGWAVDMEFYTRFLKAVTGSDEFDVSALMKIGERIYNLERMYNIREGMDPAEDTLPTRFLEENLEESYRKNPKVPLETMLKDYYNVRKWDSRGIPLPKKLKELELKLLEGL